MTLVAATPRPDERTALAASRVYCRELTKTAAKNFYYGMRLLPEPKRSDMFALYAYMRLVDDIADREDGRSIERRNAELEAWRASTHVSLRGLAPNDDSAVWPAFTDLAARHEFPPGIFDAVIAGQQQDLAPISFQTFEPLHEYCYRVAGVVGLASICIWGYEGGKETEAMAVALGVGFQLTNILRDLKEDAGRGRLYLPKEDLEAVGLAETDLRSGRGGPAFEKLMRFEIDRAESYYQKAKGLEKRVSPDSRPTLVAMTEIYHRLLQKVSESPGAVLRKRVSLSTWSKLRIGWRATRASRAAAAAAL